MNYLDTSAFLKLVRAELRSEALRAFLHEDPRLTASTLLRSEAIRAVRRRSPSLVERTTGLFENIRFIPVDDQIIDTAGRLEPPALRTLDAIHVASAIALGAELGALVTYDRRMADAARAAGLSVVSPE